MSSERKFWGEKTFSLITGASQGIGQRIAIEFCKKFGPSSKVVLTARSLKGLEETKKAINETSPDVDVQTETYDMSIPEMGGLNEIVCKHMDDKYNLKLLVHNAGTEGEGQLTKDMTDLEYWQSYMALNVYSVTMLTSAFLNCCKRLSSEDNISIVNITSLAAVQPIKGMGHYCVGKSGREMFFRTLAEENPNLDVLNYSPGPVKTDMVERVITKLQFVDVKDMFVGMKQSDKLVKPEETTARLMKILSDGNYKSGHRIDFFDRH